jgi:tetratricopeptide (TPR) repeat protein
MTKRGNKPKTRQRFPQLSVGSGAAVAAAPGQSASTTRIAALCQQGRFDEAERLLRGALSSAPRDHAALHMLGTIRRQKGDGAGAIELFRRSIAIIGGVAGYHADLGMAYLESRMLSAAEDCYRRVLALEPGSPAGLLGLGTALLGQKSYAAAATALEAALATRPDHAETHLSLGTAMIGAGRVDDGIGHCRRAIELNPGSAGGHLRLGMALASRTDFPTAYDHFVRAVELDPNLAEAHYQLGVALHALKFPDAAVTALKRALALRPKMVKALDRLGGVLSDLQRHEEAISYYQRAIALDPRSPALHRAIAQALHLQSRFEEARAAFGRVVELAPEDAEAYVGIGLTYEPEGRFEEAVTWHKKAIALDSNNAAAHHALTMMHWFEDTEARVREFELLLQTDALDDDRRAVLNFALGRLYDDAGDYGAAFRCLKVANDIRKAQHHHSPEDYSASFDRIITTFSRDLFQQKAGMGSQSERPVFVFGMMRSGTSLVEQILASHPDVHGHGEFDGIRALEYAMAERLGRREPYPDCVPALDAATARDLAEAHLTRLKQGGAAAMRSVDKHVFNYARLGLIALLFPRARLIHCMRDPLDTCLSGYFQDFGPRNVFCYDLEHFGCCYRDYQRLMAHWRAVLPITILDVPYEELIGDQVTWSRKLVDFIGLPWDERCLAFHETERPVFTASLWQVRQPIYSSSIARWRHYAMYLGPLFDALGITPEAA